MALTFTAVGPVVAGGNGRSVKGTITFDSSYPTGGESYTASLFGLSIVEAIDFTEQAGGYTFDHDKTNKKIKVYSGGSASGTSSAGSSHTHTFTGTSPAVTENYTITHDAAPGGNAIYLKFGSDGVGYLCCNCATTTSDRVLGFTNSKKLMLKHDASASGGLQVYYNRNGVADQQLLVNNAIYGVDIPIKMATGGIVYIKNDASAASNGVAIKFDDGADQRIEATMGDAANHTVSCSGSYVWLSTTPVGSNGNEAAHTHTISAAAASEVANTTNLSTVIVEVEVSGR